jgi:hypothetical protein
MKLEELANTNEYETKRSVILQLSGIKNQEKKIAEIIKKYYLTGNEDDKNYFHDIDHIFTLPY